MERLFSLLSRPNEKGGLNSVDLGQALLNFPLSHIFIRALSTGQEYEISAQIEACGSIGEKRKKMPIAMPNIISIPNCTVLPIGDILAKPQGFRILSKKGEELYVVYTYKKGEPVIISAGLTQVPSAPTKKITTIENLEKDFRVLSSLIENTVNLSYVHGLRMLNEFFKDNKNEELNGLHNYLKMNFTYAIKSEIGLCIQAPISADEIFDDFDIEMDICNCNDPPPDNQKQEPPPHVGKVHEEIDPKKIRYKLEDVAGIDDQKDQIIEILSFIESPERFKKLGAEIPTGVLLEGPPGTGKTMLAQAVAKEANIPFFRMDGSAFVEVYVGVGAGRVRALFDAAQEKAPCIIFIDEIDAIASSRGNSSGSSGEREQALNQLLAKMDGFEENSGVIVMAATNQSDVLDSAILSRFNRKIIIPFPDLDAREKILHVHSKTKPLARGVNLREIANSTGGFSGRDLKNLLNEASLLAVKRNKNKIRKADIEDALEKIQFGTKRSNKNRIPEELIGTAYHEAGHALIGALLRPFISRLEKVTILQHDNALGLTIFAPVENKKRLTKKELLAKIKMGLGGRAAEIIKFNEENVSTGASQDIEEATRIVRKMIKEWGLSRLMGPVNYGSDSKHQYLGYNISSDAVLSEKTKENIDNEVKDIIEKMLAKAEKMLRDNRSTLDAIAKALLQKETLDGNEVRKIIKRNISSTPIVQIDDEDDNEEDKK